MFVSIAPGPADSRVSVEDADDCTRLHVAADGVDDATAGTVLRLSGLGWPGEAGHVWLDVSALRARARAGTDATDWEDRFDDMLSYARRKGWLDATGELVAAHISRSGS